jgi:hypothetical protein
LKLVILVSYHLGAVISPCPLNLDQAGIIRAAEKNSTEIDPECSSRRGHKPLRA